MFAFILRRRKLGRTSCKEIANNSKQGIVVIRNDANLPAADVVFRWGTTNNVPKINGQLVVNSAESIHWCADKKRGRLEMQEAGVPVPKTWDARKFLHDQQEGVGEFRTQYVLRRPKHAQGKDLWHGDGAYIRQMIVAHNVQDGYVSQLINKVAEYRVYVIQGRVACVAKKTPGNPDDVAWNVARGGAFENVRWGDWPMAAIAASVLAAQLSGTDFCGVDVMMDGNGKPYVLEVNSAPSLTSPYRQKCFTKAFDYIVQNKSTDKINIEQFKRWRDVVHPAITADA